MEEEKIITNEIQQHTPKNSIRMYVLLVGFQITFFIAGAFKRTISTPYRH